MNPLLIASLAALASTVVVFFVAVPLVRQAPAQGPWARFRPRFHIPIEGPSVHGLDSAQVARVIRERV